MRSSDWCIANASWRGFQAAGCSGPFRPWVCAGRRLGKGEIRPRHTLGVVQPKGRGTGRRVSNSSGSGRYRGGRHPLEASEEVARWAPPLCRDRPMSPPSGHEAGRCTCWHLVGADLVCARRLSERGAVLVLGVRCAHPNLRLDQRRGWHPRTGADLCVDGGRKGGPCVRPQPSRLG